MLFYWRFVNTLILIREIQMNDTIQKLALQCGAWNQVYDNKELMVDRTFDIEKLAELVVKECIDICESGTSTQTTSGGAAILIKQRFGIK